MKKSRDHFQKPKTSNEKIEELTYHVNHLYKINQDLNSRLIAISRAKIEPNVLATFILDNMANEEYMKNLNLSVDAVLAEKNKAIQEFSHDKAPDTNSNMQE